MFFFQIWTLQATLKWELRENIESEESEVPSVKILFN